MSEAAEASNSGDKMNLTVKTVHGNQFPVTCSHEVGTQILALPRNWRISTTIESLIVWWGWTLISGPKTLKLGLRHWVFIFVVLMMTMTISRRMIEIWRCCHWFPFYFICWDTVSVLQLSCVYMCSGFNAHWFVSHSSTVCGWTVLSVVLNVFGKEPESGAGECCVEYNEAVIIYTIFYNEPDSMIRICCQVGVVIIECYSMYCELLYTSDKPHERVTQSLVLLVALHA